MPDAPTTNYSGRRVLVVGGGGFIGSHLVRRLVAAGALVSVLDRSRGRLVAMCAPDAYSFVECELSQSGQTVDAVRALRPDLAFHLVAEPDGTESFEHVRASILINAVATLNVLEGLRQCGAGLVVYGGSSKVYGEVGASFHSELPLQPLSSYAIGKAAGWQLCELYRRLYGIAAVAIRPTLIYGPQQAFNIFTFVMHRILDGNHTITLAGGRQTRDPLYIDDATEAYLEAGIRGAAGCDGRVINVGGGQEVRVIDLVDQIAAIMGKKVEICENPARMRPTDTKRSWCDNREAYELLGWEPRVARADGIRRTLECEREAWRQSQDALQGAITGIDGDPDD